MNSHEEHDVFLIPRNFIEKGTFFGGMLKIRNAIEGGVLALAICIPVLQLPLSVTTRIIILCITALPAAMVSIIGIGGESLTAFLYNAARFLWFRRIVYRSDKKPMETEKPRRVHVKPRNKEPKEKKKRKRGKDEGGPEPPENPEDTRKPKKKEPRTYDTTNRGGIRRQAREDIRHLKYEKRMEKRQLKRQKRMETRKKPEEKPEKTAQEKETGTDSQGVENQAEENQTGNAKILKRKRRSDATLEDYLPIKKIAHGVIYTTDHRYVKILEIEPINFLLRSAREQQGIIYSFISYLKISPVKLHIKMISKKADINKHLEQAAHDLDNEGDIRCQALQEDYIRFVKNLSSREAVSRRFFLMFEYEPFNANRKVEEREILAALETAVQTARTFLYQCGNAVTSHNDEDAFTADVLYTLLNRSLSSDVPFSDWMAHILSGYMEEQRLGEIDNIPISRFVAPEYVDFKHPGYAIINGVYHAYLIVPSEGYKDKVMAGWLSLLINAGEGIDIDFFLHRQPKDRIQQRLGQQIRINRSKIKDASDTNADFDDLDSAIQAGYYLKQGLADNEDFYYMNLLITITASEPEELQWRIQEMKKLLVSQDMDLYSCYFLQERGFLSTLPLASLDKKLFELSKRNVLTSGAASCYPFTSYSICDDNGILFGVNKHNNSLVIADIFDSRQYKNSNICILGCSGAGKTFVMQTMALRMRRKGIQVFIIAPLKGHEFYRACNNIGGEFIQISPASQHCINIMETQG